jgi:hypothetical protein
MKKKIINSAVFFTILYWLVVYFVQRSSHFLSGARPLTWAALAAGSLLLLALARPLLPVFERVLAVTARIGSLVFALITMLVFFLLLTPISLLMRLAGKVFMPGRFDPRAATYYEPWQVSEDAGKQF